MTNEEFDSIDFKAGDEVIVRKYFGKEVQEIEYVNFKHRIVNGYTAAEILAIIKYTDNTWNTSEQQDLSTDCA